MHSDGSLVDTRGEENEGELIGGLGAETQGGSGHASDLTVRACVLDAPPPDAKHSEGMFALGMTLWGARGIVTPVRHKIDCMNAPGRLYDLTSTHEVPQGLPLIAGLTGFTDAGSAVSQLGSYLLDNLENEVIATFDNDSLLDYRARRPMISFDQDHVTDYRPVTLKLYLVKDELQRPFLLLSGFEPDFRWQAFSESVLGLIDQFAVSTVTWVQAIPIPAPHTRPIGVTVSGNRSDLIDSLSVWKPSTQIPAQALHLVEYRLQRESFPVSGLVLLIPHYLADTEYPAAVITALDDLTVATGLIFPTDQLREADREFVANIDQQVAANAELGKLVGALEERHDSYMEGNKTRSPLTDSEGELPSADEIAAELEDFLALRRHGDEDNPTHDH